MRRKHHDEQEEKLINFIEQFLLFLITVVKFFLIN